MVEAKIRVVASTTDLASIAHMIGGDEVTVVSICQGPADPHYIQILPSYMVAVEQADIYLKVGMDLDYWADRIIDGAQNSRLVVVDCSQNVTPLEVPAVRTDADDDGHTRGNPHYWLDPANGLHIAESITEALKHVDPAKDSLFETGLEKFTARLGAKMREWRETAGPLEGKEIIGYHSTWSYFGRAFGIDVIAFIEPRPGIEPTPSHTAQLVTLAKERAIKVIAKEPFYSDRATKSIARELNARVVNLPTSVGSVKEAGDYFALFDTLIARLSGVFSE
jgi:zinc/manganese transport system substrate-binding protein